MLEEVDAPMNFTQIVTLFATKMASCSNDDDVILQSFEAFEICGLLPTDPCQNSKVSYHTGTPEKSLPLELASPDRMIIDDLYKENLLLLLKKTQTSHTDPLPCANLS